MKSKLPPINFFDNIENECVMKKKVSQESTTRKEDAHCKLSALEYAKLFTFFN